jgi:hypothetical protein
MTIDEARTILAEMHNPTHPRGHLCSYLEEPDAVRWLEWDRDEPYVYLWGYSFTIEQLEAIVTWVKHYQTPGACPA